MAKAESTDIAKTGRRQQLVETYRMTKQSDPRIGLILIGVFVVGAAAGFAFFYWLPGGHGVVKLALAIVAAALLGLLGVTVVFGRRAQAAAYAQMEGKPGAAAAALRVLRRGWRTAPAIAVTRQQDVVHRVIGPPGIVLVGEGNPNRLRQLIGNERRKHERVVAETPVTEIVVGNGEGQVPIRKLVRHVQKLPKNVKPAEMTDILARLKALDSQRSTIPIPKGPVPTSMKGLRGNLRGR